jgi:hypothetical protein
MQAGLANQQAGLQAGLAGMQYQFGASQANAANALQAGLQNQQIQAQLAQFGAGQGLQAGLANQAAAMQAAGMQYNAGAQGAMQTQNLGLSGAEFGGQLGLNAGAQQYGLQQAQQGLNMQALMNQANLQNQAGQLNLAGYQTGLQGLGALQQGAMSAQGYQQQIADANYQNWMNGNTLPLAGEMAYAQMLGMQPLPYTMQNQYSGTQTMMPAQPSIFNQALGAGIGAASALGGLGWAPFAAGGRKGGLMPGALKPVRRAKGGLGRRTPVREYSGMAA